MLLAAVFLILYFTPTVIAACRGHARWGQILFLNLLLGWTIIGWIICFFMACGNKHKNQPPMVITAVTNGSTPQVVATITQAVPAKRKMEPRPWLDALLPPKKRDPNDDWQPVTRP
jgi:hypothetical protein